MIKWGCRHPCNQPTVSETGYRYCNPCWTLIEGLTGEKRGRSDKEEEEEEEGEKILAPSSQPSRQDEKRAEIIAFDAENRDIVWAEIQNQNPDYLTLDTLGWVLNHFQSGLYDRLGGGGLENRQEVLEIVCGTMAELTHQLGQLLEKPKWVSIPLANEDGTVSWITEAVVIPWDNKRRKDYSQVEEQEEEQLFPTQPTPSSSLRSQQVL